MKTRKLLLTVLAIGLSRFLACADGLTNDQTSLRTVRHGSYTYTYMRTNHSFIYVNPGEFWPGAWKEDTNGWRVQLCIYPETNYWVPQERVMYPVSTNLMLSVEWGSAIKNSGGGYYITPNGKFAKFQLLDVKGNIVPPNPNAGTNSLERILKSHTGLVSFPDIPSKLVYGTNLPAWVSPSSGSLVSDFPKDISTNAYPHIVSFGVTGAFDGGIVGNIWTVTNRPPYVIGFLKLDEIYSVTNEGDYTLTVQPVLYKRYNHTNDAILDRVDLPSVTTKVHLVSNEK